MREQRSEEQVQQMLKSYSASNYDSDTMELIKADLEEGVEEEFINKYISRKLSFRQKAALSDAARSGVSFEFYNVLAKGFYSDRQITLLRNYYFKGIGAEQIENNINREMSPHAIKKVLDEVVKNVPMLKADSKEIQKEEGKSAEELVTAEAEQTNTEQKEEIEPFAWKEEFLAFEEKLDQAIQSLHEEVRKCIDKMVENEKQLTDYQNDVLEKQLQQMQSEFNLQQEYNITLSKDNSALQNRLEKTEHKLQKTEEELKFAEQKREEQQTLYERCMAEVEALRKEKEDMMKTGQSIEEERKTVEQLSFEEAAKHYETDVHSGKQIKTNGQMDFVISSQDPYLPPIRVENGQRRNREGLFAMAGKKIFGGKIKAGLIKCIQDAKLSTSQIKQIGNAMKAGLTDHELMDLIKSGMEADKMEQMIEIVMLGRQYQ